MDRDVLGVLLSRQISDFGSFDLDATDLDALVGSGHGLPAGDYGVVKVIGDNGTPTNSGDDNTVYQLQEVVWDATGTPPSWMPKAATSPTELIASLSPDSAVTSAVGGLTPATSTSSTYFEVLLSSI